MAKTREQLAYARAKGAQQPEMKYVDAHLQGEDKLKAVRREVAFGGITDHAKAWRDNRFFREAFMEAYADESTGLRGAHEGETWQYEVESGEGSSTAYSSTQVAGSTFRNWGTLSRKEYNKWAHRLATRATELHNKWTEEQMSREEERKQRGAEAAKGIGRGQGRGSILTSAGGVTGQPGVERRSLLGGR